MLTVEILLQLQPEPLQQLFLVLGPIGQTPGIDKLKQETRQLERGGSTLQYTVHLPRLQRPDVNGVVTGKCAARSQWEMKVALINNRLLQQCSRLVLGNPRNLDQQVQRRQLVARQFQLLHKLLHAPVELHHATEQVIVDRGGGQSVENAVQGGKTVVEQ